MKQKQFPQNAAAVEKANLGFIAVSGPYNINNKNLRRAAEDQLSLDNSLADQQRLCPHAKRVDHGPMVWIIRKKPMIVEATTKMKKFTCGKLGIKGGKSFVEHKERVRL